MSLSSFSIWSSICKRTWKLTCILIKTPPVLFALASSKKLASVTNFPLFLFFGFLTKPLSFQGISIVAAMVILFRQMVSLRLRKSNSTKKMFWFRNFTLESFNLTPVEVKCKNSVLCLDFRDSCRPVHIGSQSSSNCREINISQAEGYFIFWHLNGAVYYICPVCDGLLIGKVTAARVISTCSIVRYYQTY